MNILADYLFWKVAHYFIHSKKYRIIEGATSQNELWLERIEEKNLPLVRLLRYDLDWSQFIRRDMERTLTNAEQLRKRLTRGQTKLLNIYVSTLPPVDDYESILTDDRFNNEFGKVVLVNKLLSERGYESVINDINTLTGGLLLIPDTFHEDELHQLRKETLQSAMEERRKEQAVFSYGKPLFTYILMAIQILMFLILEVSGGSTNSTTLIHFGAKFNPLILQGEWWRFFTPIFLHIGFVHLLMNTLALYYLGPTIERIFGRARFLAIYFTAGFFGSLASFLFNTGLSAGASGAIFGCFGALLYFGVVYPSLFFRTMGLNILVVIAINLSLGFTMPGIDNAGHIGGLIGGFIMTAVCHFPKQRRWLTQLAACLITVTIAAGMIGYGYSHSDELVGIDSKLTLADYYMQEERFQEAEQLLTDAIQTSDDTANLYFQLSYAQIQLGKLEKAKGNLLHAINADGELDEAYYNLAILLANEGDHEQALAYAQKALELAPDREDYQVLIKKLNQQSS